MPISMPSFTCDVVRVHDGDGPCGADRARRFALPASRRRTSKALSLAAGPMRAARIIPVITTPLSEASESCRH